MASHQNGVSLSSSRSAVIVVVVVVVCLRHPSSRAVRPIATSRCGVNKGRGGRNAAALDEEANEYLRRHWCHGSF
jgi:hypothetical protein